MKKLLLACLVLISGCMSFDKQSFATSITMPYCTQNTGDTILASHWNGNCSTVQSFLNNQNLDGTTNIAAGGILTANIANLAVTDAKISGITTSGKVNGSAITGINNLPSGAGVIPTVNLGSGTANSTTFLRGDQTWSSPLGAYILITNSQTNGTGGGTATSGSWSAIPVNTTNIDTASNVVSNTGGTFVLVAGTYDITATSPFYEAGSVQTRLQNTTSSATILTGSSETAGTGNSQTSTSTLIGRFTIAASQSLQIQYQCSSTKATVGLGNNSSFGTEVYTQIQLYRIS